MRTAITGKIAELRFLARALNERFTVASPVLDSHWDFLIVGKRISFKIQIKSTSVVDKRGCYHIMSAHGNDRNKKYSNQICDFMAIYIEPKDIWYLIPLKGEIPLTLRLYPERDLMHGRWESYKEAWHLLHEALAEESFHERGYCAR